MIYNSYLLGLFGGTAQTGLDTTTAASLRQAARKQPTPPWSTSVEPPKADALVRAALGGRKFINENAAQLDIKGASADYRKLFALYQGLDTLNALVNRSVTKGVGALELTQLDKRFSSGLAEIGSWLSASQFDAVRMVQGTSKTTSKTTAAVPRDSANSITGPIHEGSVDTPVAAFQGDTRFNITIKVPIGIADSQTTAVPIDLADMGAAPRTFDNVLDHINAKLEAAGFQTRIGREQIKAEPRVIQVNGKAVTLPGGPDKWALAIRGTSTETVGFTAADTSDAVYVVQSAGSAGAAQLLKFQSDGGTAAQPTGGGVGETHWVAGRLSQDALPAGVENVRASAVGPDGSLWIVADVTAGPDTQPIKGVRDVVLMKYDTAGRLVATRTLGAASTASGYAIAVDANGDVAVAGSVTGALNTKATDAGKTGDVADVADSFVTVFDKDGQELWAQRRGARAADEATSVSFGADGVVYIGGRAKSALTGAAAVGGWDGYVQAFKAGEPYPTAGIVVAATATTQFGTGSDDSVDAMTIDGSNLYTAGVENGQAVIRHFTLDAGGVPTLASTRDLGPISGEIGGVAVSGGQVIVTGTSRDSGITAGTVTTAHSGGKDVFVATLSGDLSVSAGDRMTWYGGAGDDNAADVKVHNGKVWITGVADRDPAADDEDPTQGYLVRLDPLSGAVEYEKTWSGDGNQARPLTLAVAAGGASVLDRLGLPQGEIDQSDSKRLVDATSLRVGDRFYISPADGGRSVSVTIAAKDTLATLARKIEIASNGKLKVTVASEGSSVTGTDGEITTTTGGFQRLSIMARDGKSGAVLTPGETGRDALAGLGLSSGFIGASTGDEVRKTFGLDLPGTLRLADAAAAKTAGERIQAAMKAVRDAYRSLDPANSASAAPRGPVPAYLTNQLANYQAALARLGG
ncbi:MAG: transcriptional regulator [Brevundimonas sp.]|uniref:transcriptional regulator n=1 Tax=Brevundimonas sp. TaxID=1871086 RepID=UPI0026106EA6|nr:transcriptional regulator [Brevundimonas sp.]MDI6623468.1 transcriptional regulator [Brevundimonas sp.]MDQ7812559.1 transcriptional regulator [Brevundimonas sp.]